MLNGAGNRSCSSFVTEAGLFGRGRDQPLPGFLPSVSASNSHSQLITLTRSMDNLALSQNGNRSPSARLLWTSQVIENFSLVIENMNNSSLLLLCCTYFPSWFFRHILSVLITENNLYCCLG